MPDKGIWEPRVANQHHTHSKLMCWVAMNKLLQLHDAGFLRKLDRETVRRIRDEIGAAIREKAWNEKKQTYTAVFGGEEVDASLLLLAKHEFERPSSARMRLTYKRITEEIAAGSGLLYRYRDKLSAGEGAFGICSFWLAEYLALGGGSLEESKSEFRKLLGYSNDLGLFSEEIDAATGQALGNFPQAFTHVGLINAALTLADRCAKEMDQERVA